VIFTALLPAKMSFAQVKALKVKKTGLSLHGAVQGSPKFYDPERRFHSV
jgi:hypothetical protein